MAADTYLKRHEYFKTKNGVLYCGDSREILPRLKQKIDACITDPVWPNCPKGLLKGWENPKKLLQEVLKPIRPKRIIIIMRSDSEPRFLMAVPSRYPFFKLQILPYVIPGYCGRKLGGDEIAYIFGEPIPSSKGHRVIPTYGPKCQPQDRDSHTGWGYVKHKKTLKAGHPGSRALKHMVYVVYWNSVYGDTIIDPFAGQGTILRACEEQARHWIGVEIEEKWCLLAKESLKKEIKQVKIHEMYVQPELPMGGLNG